MTDKVTVRALRPFDNGDEMKDENSAPFDVSRQRFAELKANRLVDAVGGGSDGGPSDVETALAAAGARVTAAGETVDKSIAEHEARVADAQAKADQAVAEHEARAAAARTAADEAIAAEERRAAEAAQKNRPTPDNKNGAAPQNKAK